MKKIVTSKVVKKPMRKMQEGGGPSEPGPGQVYESIKNKYRKKYYTPDNIYLGKKDRKQAVDTMIEKQARTEMDARKKKGIANKWQEGGPTSTSPQLKRVAGRIAKKEAQGKPVSDRLVRKQDKAVNKIIVKNMTKAKTGGMVKSKKK
jgi:hypothetical protein